MIPRQKGIVTRKIPIVRCSFHTETACYQTFGTELSPTDTPDPTYQITGLQTQKQLQTPAGSFGIDLVGDSWVVGRKLKSNDLVVISMGYMGDATLTTVMVGLIDSVSRSRSIGDDGIPTVSTHVSGRDFGKILIKSLIKWYPQLGILFNQTAPAVASTYFLASTSVDTLKVKFSLNKPNQLIGSLPVLADLTIRCILQKIVDIKWIVYNETSTSATTTNMSGKKTTTTANKLPQKTVGLPNILRYVFANTLFRNVNLPASMSIETGDMNCWNLLERIAMKPFTELFVDTRVHSEVCNDKLQSIIVKNIEEISDDSKASLAEDSYATPAIEFGEDRAVVCLFMRNTPFDTDDFKALKTHTIGLADVHSEDLSYSDNEHYNLFSAGMTDQLAQINGTAQSYIKPPIFDASGEANALRYGLAPLEVPITSLVVTPTSIATDDGKQVVKDLIAEDSSKLASKLKDWFGRNHERLSGSIAVRGNGDYKVGDRLLYSDLVFDNPKNVGYDFYIEGVTHNFRMYSAWRTTLTVTRGDVVTSTTTKSPTNKATSTTAIEGATTDAITTSETTTTSTTAIESATTDPITS